MKQKINRWISLQKSTGVILSAIDFQKNNFTALSVGDGRKRPIPSLLPYEMNFLKVYILMAVILFSLPVMAKTAD
ncbi:MAG TPA: hypothetical protein VLP30_07915, partial [Desulfatirhabdiaceae bacterium]|nr:hypothetical protein [Desulfatirhabdiaceae bacterium]